MTTLTLTLPSDLVERLDRYGERLGTSTDRATLAEVAIRTFLVEHDEPEGGADGVSVIAEAQTADPSGDDAALLRFMDERGYAKTPEPFRVTPAEQGSGLSDVSVDHGRYVEDVLDMFDHPSDERQLSPDREARHEAVRRRFVDTHPYVKPLELLRITPVETDDGIDDLSIEHDRYFEG